jgi:pentatricopeptide repeat protein
VHSRIIEAELESNIHVVTALIRMYTKYGSLADGHWVFDRMLTQDLVSWTMMISGYVKQGYTEETFKLFYQMHADDLKLTRPHYQHSHYVCKSSTAGTG